MNRRFVEERKDPTSVRALTNVGFFVFIFYAPEFGRLSTIMLYNRNMLRRAHKRYGATALASFIAMAALMMATDPVNNVIYAALFFILALIFLISLGYFLVRLQTGEVSSRNRYRTVSVSLVLVILLMFRSAKSLSWVDGIILVLIGFGLVFYISKRSAA